MRISVVIQPRQDEVGIERGINGIFLFFMPEAREELQFFLVILTVRFHAFPAFFVVEIWQVAFNR